MTAMFSAAEHLSPAPDANIVILTGAGISKESGIDTFRDAGGIWSQVRIEDVATPDAFARDPDRVHAFYNMRRRRVKTLNVVPNAAHLALARLEREWRGGVLVVTQNVDGLHEQAGSTNVLHMHGRHAEARCNHCGHVRPCDGDLSTADVCGACDRAGGLRPNVVWFGETPFFMDEIQRSLGECDLFLSIGTSGNVYPAAGFVALVRRLGRAHSVELNLEPSAGATHFAESHYGPATDVVTRYVGRLLDG